MTFYSGLEGSFWIKDQGDWVKVAAVTNWSFTQNQAVLDTTVLGDTDRTLIDSVRSASGSASLFYYNPEASPEDDTGAGRLLKKILKPLSKVDPSFNEDTHAGGSTGDTKIRSTRCAFRLQANKDLSQIDNTGSSTEKYLWLSTYLTSFQMTMAVGEVLSCDVTFEVDGTAIYNSFSVYGDADVT